MKISELPSYVLGGEFETADMCRAKQVIGKIESEISSVTPDDIKKTVLIFSERDLLKFKRWHSDMTENTLSLIYLFQKYLIMARNSNSVKFKEIANLFNEDFHHLYEMVKEITENKVNSVCYVNLMKKLIRPYNSVIIAFTDMMNNAVLNREQYFPKTEEDDFISIVNDLEKKRENKR